jgi:hypothetical protein
LVADCSYWVLHPLLQVAQILNIVQSLLLPFALVPVVHVCADKKLLGRFASHPALTVFAALIAATVAGVDGYLVVQFMEEAFEDVSDCDGVKSVSIMCDVVRNSCDGWVMMLIGYLVQSSSWRRRSRM